MPVDYVDRIRRVNSPELLKLLEHVRSGSPMRGWPKGKAFEHIILRGFEIEGADVVWPFEVKHQGSVIEQIDGAVYYNGIGCLIEAKDYQGPVNIEPIAKLRNQLLRRPPAAMGIVFARSDFSEPMKDLTRMMNPLQILLWGYDELEYALEKQRMCAALHLKYKRALEHGMPDFNVKGKL